MSHALLLRLFLSPYFNISVAMHYLKTYPESIGISHYLCWRMKQMRAEEVEFYWPQICHLLITRPTESNALESFVIGRAEESTHSAMLTFWFMQAALRDLTVTRSTNPRPFMICQRVLHRCHEIIFGDSPDSSQSPYKSLPTTPYGSSATVNGISGPNTDRRKIASTARRAATGLRDRYRQQKVNAHIPAAIIGMSVVLAGTPALPELTEMIGEVAVMQGRQPRDDLDGMRKRIEIDMDDGSEGPKGMDEGIPHDAGQGSISDDSDPEAGLRSSHGANKGSIKANEKARDRRRLRMTDSTAAKSASGSHNSMRNMANTSTSNLALFPSHPSHTSPSLMQTPSAFEPSHLLPSPSGADKTPRPSSKPHLKPDLADIPPRPSSAVPSGRTSNLAPFQSAPTLTSQQMRHHPLRMPMPSPENLLAMYAIDSQRALLRSHYCRSEFRFLSALEDISTRLLVIPKPARLSALRAELTGLNHSLPAEVCMPMWCPADHSHEDGGETRTGTSLMGRRDREPSSRVRGHHRIVRISPGDSVVLNSAQKVPYLLHLEILEDDLDFDPTRRSNRELLKKLVVQLELKKRKLEGVETVESDRTDESRLGPNGIYGFERKMEQNKPNQRPSISPRTRHSAGPSSPMLRQHSSETPTAEDPEEVDLIEQLFGADYSSKDRKVDLADSLPVPIAPKNQLLDAAAWSKADSDISRPPSSGIPGSNLVVGSPHVGSPQIGAFSPVEELSNVEIQASWEKNANPRPVITLQDYSERMRTAAVMLAQLNSSMKVEKASAAGGDAAVPPGRGSGRLTMGAPENLVDGSLHTGPASSAASRMKLDPIQATAIRDRIMQEMMSLEEERVSRMTAQPEGYTVQPSRSDGKTAEDERIIRQELNKEDPSAVIFKESWSAKKSRIQAASPWGHLARWNVLSVIVKTGDDLRQEQLATQLIQRFGQIWREENSDCWVRFFRILVTGDNTGLVETITDAVSVHSIKKAEYARRVTQGTLGNVTLMDYFVQTYGEPDTGRFAKAQRNFIKSLAAYSVITFLLQIKDRHNGNILIDREGHLIHIDFGFMLSNSPGGNMRFEAAPFKLTMDYVEIMGGIGSPGFLHFKKLFKEGFEAARKHSDSIITMVELMQRNSKLDCFQMYGEQTAMHLRERFQLGLTTQAVDAYMERLILTSVGSSWTRLYDSYQYLSEGVL